MAQYMWTKRLYWDAFYSTDEPKENLPVTHAEMDGFRRHVLTPGARTAIDVGSGWGLLATLMAREGLRTVGYDWSPVAVDRARTFWSKEERLSFQVHDFLRQTPPRELVPGSVDVVACRLTLPYLDRHIVMTDFRRWLKPRTGVLYLVVQVRERQQPGRDAVSRTWSSRTCGTAGQRLSAGTSTCQISSRAYWASSPPSRSRDPRADHSLPRHDRFSRHRSPHLPARGATTAGAGAGDRHGQVGDGLPLAGRG
ncbi:class I SAM-dependent methyltransferase [Streptomyces subrutilus]|uniref:class I SAM-dependent methyltransferase n=1 Tax=Streptomyces subrutilus TaxID=36818 RepID=UPI000AE6132B